MSYQGIMVKGSLVPLCIFLVGPHSDYVIQSLVSLVV